MNRVEDKMLRQRRSWRKGMVVKEHAVCLENVWGQSVWVVKGYKEKR